jgi:DNA-binding LacI/PurR family transcriptional regulator
VATGRRPSSLDVARLAGVSPSAVSRAFTPGASVSAATRGKVRTAAEQLGYQPNALPRMLLTARSNLVALIVGELTNPFYPEVQRLFLEALQARGRRVLLFALEGGAGGVDEALREVLKYRVDGVIVTSATISRETAAACGRMRTPVVLFNRTLRRGGDVGTSSVCCDNVEAGRLVANLLLDAGHRRPAFVLGDPAASTNRDRETGFLGRLGERGLWDVPKEGGVNSYDAGHAAALALCAGPAGDRRPDALFCASDIVALGTLDALRHELGLRVPEDVSVVGFDDIPMAGWASYRLTTVRQRRRRMVERAVAMLVSKLEGGVGQPQVELVPGELVVRASARVPAGSADATAGPGDC